MIIDFEKNRKQEEFFNTAVDSLCGKNNYRNLFYGGAIRGGKSFVCATTLLFAAKKFHNSRWHIFRKDFPALQSTIIPSFEKILSGNSAWGWSRDKSNYFIYNRKTDGKIFFKGENIDRDPELMDLLGLETNGIFYEQIEELSKKLWEMGSSRLGSWYIDDMPAPITLATFNPTQRWIKKMIYEPWRRGELKAPYYYLSALPSDNGYVTKEQWDAWSRLDERYKKQFIESDWTDFADKNNIFAFAFYEQKHLSQDVLQADRNETLYLSFDFNKNPISCGVFQHKGCGYDIKVIESIKLANSDIYALCDYIKVFYPNYLYVVTGDASGNNTTALVRDNLNFYKVIKTKLLLSDGQIKVPSVNPRIEENQVLVNSILANGDLVISGGGKCDHLIYDLHNVKTSPDGKIQKTDRTDASQQADALDNFRYYLNTFHRNFLKTFVN